MYSILRFFNLMKNRVIYLEDPEKVVKFKATSRKIQDLIYQKDNKNVIYRYTNLLWVGNKIVKCGSFYLPHAILYGIFDSDSDKKEFKIFPYVNVNKE